MNTITEACALNTLLMYILQDKHKGMNGVPTSASACEAAALLTDKARKTGAAAYSAEEVRRLWKEKKL